ncbi:GNAT family N-acetyltransferase [Bacillus sp. S3]|uniref:GNAT family N-acetyltransferase n=1 Tax=Bacillus sp. S3 TaxID=486398 RepID=UPI00118B2EF8|nr:GNAT family N-acetyltransferase [Bacillus sp. S3]QCJ42661.1 GNAT family N-acetyltransferase [Bacillus sp. S3]
MSLKSITQENWHDCIQLQVSDDQKSYVASNVYSLAESRFEPSFTPMGIYLDARMIGFLMYGKDPDDGTYWIIRFMIDQTEQGKGFGKQALAHTLTFLKELPDCSSTIILGVKDSNVAALKLYQSFGFKDTGRREHGEILLEFVI